MTKITVRQALESDRGSWDDYVRNHPDASPYHLFAWLQAVNCSYHHSIFRLIAFRGDRIVGILPLAFFRLSSILCELVAGPYCDRGSCLADSASEEEALLKKAIEIAQQKRVSRLHLRGKLVGTLPTGIALAKPSNNKVSMILGLPGSTEELWNGFGSKLRSQIRKAEKNGLTFKWGNVEDLEDFYSVFSQNMLDLGSPVHSRRWFENVLKKYENQARMGLVYHNNEAIGCGIVLFCRDNVAIPWASTLRKYNKLNPNMLLYWNFLRYSVENEYNLFDFGRSTPGEGTYNFKYQWKAKPHPLFWGTYYLTGHSAKKANCQMSSRDDMKGMASLWARLPLWLANFLGPRLRRFINL